MVFFFSFCSFTAIMFLISWTFTIVSLALASLIYYYVSIKGKAGDWGDGFKSAYFQLALRSLRSLGGMYEYLCIIYTSRILLYCCFLVFSEHAVPPQLCLLFWVRLSEGNTNV